MTPTDVVRPRVTRHVLMSLALVLALVALLGPFSRPGTADTATDEPPATPQAACGPGSKPETGLQGRVPAEEVASGRAAEGYSCNATRTGGLSAIGQFKVHRYVDAGGRECAFVDNGGRETGTRVIDMADPANPKIVRHLTSPAMYSPHESLQLHQGRGLLIAVMGTFGTAPGFVDIYDLREDCLNPTLLASSPMGEQGHESGLSPDGRTVWATSLVDGGVTAVDIGDPTSPKLLWAGRYNSHGLSVSPDGNYAYLAVQPAAFLLPKGNAVRNVTGPLGLVVLDVSDIQERKPLPQVTEVSRLEWPEASVPQNSFSMTVKDKPYLVEFDEFRDYQSGSVGAARILDSRDPSNLKVVSNLRLEVNQRVHYDEVKGDPNGASKTGGYTAHYCSAPRADDPGIVACSFIKSGLRVFDVRDPHAPVEVAYYNAPQAPGKDAFALTAPAFVPERREIWYADGNLGFHVIRLASSAWPGAKR